MISEASEAPDAATARTILEASRALGPQLRAAAEQIERERRLPLALVSAMQGAGVFRKPMPRAWGGPEADPLTQIDVIEALSAADGSAGWCAMIGSDGGYFTAFLDDAVGRELYHDLDAVTASSARPLGRAVAVAGGYRVTGRWAFASACQHATWFVPLCVVFDGEAPRQTASGAPETRMCYVRTDACEIVDTWTTTGLRGSGSHDVAVTEVFVPAERTFDLFTAPPRRPGALYALRTMFKVNAPGVPLGIARGAIDGVVALATSKVGTYTGTGLREEAGVQQAVARADALVSAARGYVFDTVGDLWATLRAGDPPAPQQRARYGLCLAASCAWCVEAVDLMYQVAGGTALYAPHPLDRALRDIHTLGQHAMFSPKVFETAGRILLGLAPDPRALF
jgi:alkylation response protein AidB-like acyl-CoA dehydrogenase